MEKDAVVLASGSPRRAKILRDAGVAFTVLRTDAPEVSYPDDPGRTVRENARAKWLAGVRAAGPGRTVLAADTIVWYGDRIYGKPRDLAEAREFLRELGGNTHVVYTGVACGKEGAEPFLAVETSRVTFRPLPDAEIEAYVQSVRPVDRAGAYDIDESGDRIVASFTGEYENIMGLPLAPLRRWGILARPAGASQQGE